MKRFLSSSRLLATALLLVAQTSRLSGGDTNLGGWGTLTDPDGDCAAAIAGDTLTIRVPASSRPHDLAPDLNTTNAPRVLKSMDGDFKRAVRVAGTFDPGTESTQPTRFGFNGAGLVAMVDERNYFVVFHGVFQRPSENEPVSYVNFALCVNGKPQDLGQRPVPQNGSVGLGFARKGTKMSAAMSADGKDVVQLGAVDMPAGWPSALRVGVVAISTSRREFSPQFTEPGNGAGAPPVAASPPAPALATRHFTSSRGAYEGTKATRYVDFSFDYPASAGWSLQQGAELRTVDAFAQVTHKENPTDPSAIEAFVVGYFNSNNERSVAETLPVLAPQLMAQMNANNAKSYPNYRKLSEGPVKFGAYNAYELRGTARITSGAYANSDLWIRMVAVAPNDGGKNGVSLLFLSSSRAGIQNANDAGSRGDLAIIANSFRLGR